MRPSTPTAGFGIAVIAAALLAAPVSALAQQPAIPEGPAETVELAYTPGAYQPPADARPVDLVIALDVSGSMKELLDAVRASIWDVVNDLAAMEPAPDLRVGLLTFGSRQTNDREGWIAVHSDLTRDLDAVFARLLELETSGDTEYVGRVLHAALERMSWSEEWEGLRIIFVAGNESADQGVEEFDFREQVREARDREIFVNALYAGHPVKAVEHKWDRLAALGQGQLSSVGRKPEVMQIPAPVDDELARLNQQLNTTYVPIGEAGKSAMKRMAEMDGSTAKLGQQSLGSRVAVKSSGLFNQAAWDLVDAVEQPGFDWSQVPEQDLPPGLRGLSDEDRYAVIDDKRRERQELQQRIRALYAEREQHVQSVLGDKAPPRTAIGDAMRRAIRAQAEARGFSRDD